MSIRVMTDVWEHSRLKAERLLVMLALADWADDARTCFPKMESIARKARITKDGASEIVGWLEINGFLEVVVRGGGRGKANEYLLFPKGDRFKKPPREAPKTPGEKGGFRKGVSEQNPRRETPLSQPETPGEKGGFSTEAYKEEPSNLNKVLTVSEEEEERASEESPQSPLRLHRENPKETILSSHPQTNNPQSPIRLALCGVCGIGPDTDHQRKQQQLDNLTAWFEGLPRDGGTDEDVARAILERFKAWDMPKPPHLSQIRDAWFRLGKVQDMQKTKTNEVNNGTNFGSNRPGQKPAGQSNLLERIAFLGGAK